jgi:two-component system, sensor histidine kinase
MADILLVEDDAMSAKMVSLLVSREGLELDYVESGEKAVEWCREKSCRLVLMDVGMPGMSGIEASEKIREFLSQRELPIVLMSAFSEEELEEQTSEDVINDIVEKPLDVNKLQKLMKKYLP